MSDIFSVELLRTCVRIVTSNHRFDDIVPLLIGCASFTDSHCGKTKSQESAKHEDVRPLLNAKIMLACEAQISFRLPCSNASSIGNGVRRVGGPQSGFWAVCRFSGVVGIPNSVNIACYCDGPSISASNSYGRSGG